MDSKLEAISVQAMQTEAALLLEHDAELRALVEAFVHHDRRARACWRTSMLAAYASLAGPLFGIVCILTDSRAAFFAVWFCVVFSIGLGWRARKKLHVEVRRCNELGEALLARVPRGMAGFIMHGRLMPPPRKWWHW